jgi:hypothetical protein
MRKFFPSNEGPIDRIVRIAVGLALLALTFWGPSFAWGFIGIVPLLTGLVGSCPLYTLLGVRTCPYSPARKTT